MTDTTPSKDEIIILERKLAKFAGLMDSLVRIPFTKQGIGADAALSTIPFAGDIAGLVMTAYAFRLGRKMGVPRTKMVPAVKLAIADLFIGLIPFVGTLVDIFLQPSRRTLEIVHKHIAETHDMPNDFHVRRPFLHQNLERKQAKSSFWKNKIVSWIYLHIPDFFGLIILGLLGWFFYSGFLWVSGFLGGSLP